MRQNLWFIVMMTLVGVAALAAAQVGKKRELPYFCLGKRDEFFVCATQNLCVNKKAVCDGHQDCSDNSDEQACTCVRRRDCPKGQKCRKNLDLATSECTACVEGKRYNKEREQCEDINECLAETDICAGRGSCVNYDGGYECVHCPKGYEGHMHNRRDFLTANRTLDTSPEGSERRDALRRLFLCNDEDECANEDPCRTGDVFRPDQFCVNSIGNYSCHCPPQHAPQRGINEYQEEFKDNVCRAIGDVPQIAIAENASISIYDLRSTELIQKISLDEPLVDIVTYKGNIFFAHARQIFEYRVAIEAKTPVVNLEEDGDLSSEIKKISVDWIHRRIYYLTGDAISVTSFFGESAKIIDHRGNISSIAVDPVARYLFYSEQGSVRKAHLDGRPTGSSSIFQALNTRSDEKDHGGEALALDPNIGSLYYVFDRILYSFDYSGHHAVVLSTHAEFAYLEPFEDRLFAAYRSEAKGVVSVPRTGYTIGRREGSASVVTFYDSRPKAISVLHNVKHPAALPTAPCPQDQSAEVCGPRNWCFPLPTNQQPNYRCACGRAEALPSSQRKDCVALQIRLLRPAGLSQTSEYNSSSDSGTTSASSFNLYQQSRINLFSCVVFVHTFLLVFGRAV